MLWIVTDTAQEMKTDREKGLIVMNLPLLVNGEQKDGLTQQQFYELLDDDGVTISTSQASPAAFGDLFEELTKNGDEVLYVSLSSTLSGTFNSARLAAMEYENIYLVDSLEACLSQTAMVQRAMQLRDEGKDAKTIAAMLNEEKGSCELLAAVASLKYLKKGGRISPAAAMIGDLAGIKPIVTVDKEGTVAVAAKTRGVKKAVKTTAKMAAELGIDLDKPVVIGYSGLSDENAKLLAKELEELTGYHYEGEFYPLSPVLATHAGPDAAGIGFFKLED